MYLRYTMRTSIVSVSSCPKRVRTDNLELPPSRGV
jgi:hypothetical protein